MKESEIRKRHMQFLKDLQTSFLDDGEYKSIYELNQVFGIDCPEFEDEKRTILKNCALCEK